MQSFAYASGSPPPLWLQPPAWRGHRGPTDDVLKRTPGAAGHGQETAEGPESRPRAEGVNAPSKRGTNTRFASQPETLGRGWGRNR